MLKVLLWGVGVPLALFVAWALLRTPGPDEQAQWQARQAIERCWGVQGRKSMAPDMARSVAATCEGMEADFVRQWGRAP